MLCLNLYVLQKFGNSEFLLELFGNSEQFVHCKARLCKYVFNALKTLPNGRRPWQQFGVNHKAVAKVLRTVGKANIQSYGFLYFQKL